MMENSLNDMHELNVIDVCPPNSTLLSYSCTIKNVEPPLGIKKGILNLKRWIVCDDNEKSLKGLETCLLYPMSEKDQIEDEAIPFYPCLYGKLIKKVGLLEG
jgi:hypothetical protein